MLTLPEAIMMRRVVVLLTSFLIPCMYAQSGSQDRTGSVRVRVTPGDARACNIRATVSLVSTSGAHIAENLTNGRTMLTLREAFMMRREVVLLGCQIC